MPKHFGVPQCFFSCLGAISYKIATCKFFSLTFVTLFHCMVFGEVNVFRKTYSKLNFCKGVYESAPSANQTFLSCEIISLTSKLSFSFFQENKLCLYVLSYPSCYFRLNPYVL